MTISITHTPPNPSSYIDLASFQSATPDTFTRPVLHSLQKNCVIRISGEHAKLLPTLSSGVQNDKPLIEELDIQGIDVWVASESLIFYNSAASIGSEIPYFSLTLHAIQRSGNQTGVYTQIALSPDASSTTNPDVYDDDELIELTIFTPDSTETGDQTGAQELFKAMSTCAGLHADPDQESGDEEMGQGPQILLEGALPGEIEPMEGQSLEGFLQGGGWVTADNVHMFGDPEEDDAATTGLGPGAGTVRPREEDGDQATEENDDSKWRRTG